MKLEVGQFARTKLGTIGKIENNSFYIKLRLKKGNYIMIEEDDIVKASYNIIDILEEGDYVNGLYINSIDKEEGTIICYTSTFFEEDIMTIITHEQMEQMAYKVVE